MVRPLISDSGGLRTVINVYVEYDVVYLEHFPLIVECKLENSKCTRIFIDRRWPINEYTSTFAIIQRYTFAAGALHPMRFNKGELNRKKCHNLLTLS